MDKTDSLSPSESRAMDDHSGGETNLGSEPEPMKILDDLDLHRSEIQAQRSVSEDVIDLKTVGQQLQSLDSSSLIGESDNSLTHQSLQPIKIEDSVVTGDNGSILLSNSGITELGGPSPTSSTTTSGLGDLSWSSNNDSTMGNFYSVSLVLRG